MATSAFSQPLELPLSEETLSAINAHLDPLTPQQILSWALTHLPNLYQTTAFGLTGLVAIDMLSKLTTSPPPLVFLDTLYHFNETYNLLQEVKQRYGVDVAVYKPEGCEDVKAFEAKFGERLWERDEGFYDYTVKVEPAQRAYQELGIRSVITGRRASQGADRANLKPLEVDSTGLLKLNPLFAWTFAEVNAYIQTNNVPRNRLLDQGYKSVGDWHSTQKSLDEDADANHDGVSVVLSDSGERAGRWAGREKTECGLHEDYFKMKILAKKEAAAQVCTVATV